MLKTIGIRKYYGNFCVLDGLSMNVKKGALYGFVGPNGAGKTTAMRIISGILYPDDGAVLLDGAPTGPGDPELKRQIGYIPDDFGSWHNLKVSEFMSFFADCCGLSGFEASKRIETLLSYVELSEKADFYVEALSKGMKQRLSLARALIGDPELLIMDEPTSGLDPRTRYEFKQIVGELSDKGKTILISSHILSEISELCTDIGIVDQGRIILEGTLSDVMHQVTAENPVIISVSGKLSKTVRLLREDSRVCSVAVKGNDLMINFKGGPREEEALLKKLIEEGCPVVQYSREKGSLENIFMQLTGNGGEHTVLSYQAGVDD